MTRRKGVSQISSVAWMVVRSLDLNLLYSTTSALQVELTERYSSSIFKLYFADEFNAVANPSSSNPFRIYLQFQEIFQQNDRLNEKLVKHFKGLRRGTRRRLAGNPALPAALATIKTMGMHGIRPVLAILEAETYEAHGKAIVRLPPNQSGSSTSVEYLLADIQGPKLGTPELHLHHLY